ncbi:hypothetical protein DM02DRAFT_696894, partial [Periconia macrospinosa]
SFKHLHDPSTCILQLYLLVPCTQIFPQTPLTVFAPLIFMADQSYWMGGHQERGDEKPRDQSYAIPIEDPNMHIPYPLLANHVSTVEDDVFDFGQFCHVDLDYGDAPDEPDAKPHVEDTSTITSLTRHQTLGSGRSESEGHTDVSSVYARYPVEIIEVPHPYHAAHPTTSTSKSPPMPAAPYHAGEATQPEPRGPSRYESFKCHFTDSTRASLHRKECMRFGRKPYKEPEKDASIAEIEHNRIHHIERIYNAMTSSEKARDNDQSPAMKRWVHSAYYESELVESVAHKVLDCLLQQGEDEDRDVDCAGRLNNVIRALEEEKTICEDVMQSASQIRMFVNAPKAYASRKHQNRLGNRKRGQGIMKEVVDDNPRPGKASRSNARPRRGTSSTTATAPQSTNTPNFLQQPLSRHATPSAHGPPQSRTTPSFDTGMKASMTFDPGFNTPVRAMPQAQQHDQRMHSITSGLNEQFLSPPVLSVGTRSSPVTPDDAIPIHHDTDPWLLQMPTNNPNPFHTLIDPLLFDNSFWNTNDAVYGVAHANLFDDHPDAALLDSSPSAGHAHIKRDFQQFWGAQSGVQQFPQDRSHNNEPQ